MSYKVHIVRDQIVVFDGMGVVNGTNGEAVLTAMSRFQLKVEPVVMRIMRPS